MNQIHGFKLSANFSAFEARCRGDDEGMPCCCHGAVSADKELVLVLQEFRSLLDEPVAVTSWFRCEEYNRAVGGHDRSYHRHGMAADVTSVSIRNFMKENGEEPSGVVMALEEIVVQHLGDSRGNIFWYPERGFIHVDVGPLTGSPRIRRM